MVEFGMLQTLAGASCKHFELSRGDGDFHACVWRLMINRFFKKHLVLKYH